MAKGFRCKGEAPQALTKDRNKFVLAGIVGLLAMFTDVLLLVTDPVLIIAKYCVRVDYGTYVHEALSDEYEAVHISSYMFNVTNAERFQAGLDDKLKVEEIGPFVYQEIRKNEELEFDFAANSIRYSPRLSPRFLRAQSVADPHDVNVTMPNLAMLSMASKVSGYGFIPRMGFNLLASRLRSRAVVRMSVADYLWGYDEPLIRLGYELMPGFVNFDRLGVLDRLYDKKAKYRFELSAAADDKFSIRTVNGVGGLDKWGYNDPDKRSICNSFTNTYEGIGYPTEMTSGKSLRLFRPVFCRFLELDYHGTVMTPYGVQGLEFKISNRTYEKNKETECLCSLGNCVDGVSDMSPCFLGLPIVLSNAHFLDANPKLYERIEGIKPDEKMHGSSFVIEPQVGIVLDTVFSVQVNLLIRNVNFNSEVKRFSDMLIPIAYFKITQPPLAPKHQRSLNLLYFIGPGILLGVQILLAVVSAGLLAYAVKIFYSNQQMHNKQIVLVADIVQPLMR